MNAAWSRIVGGLAIAASSAVVWFCLLMLSALVSVTVGVYLLAGLGWMFICGGACLFAIAWFLRLGIAHA